MLVDTILDLYGDEIFDVDRDEIFHVRVFVGTPGPDFIEGSTGNDLILGESPDLPSGETNVFIGTERSDHIEGTDGNDLLIGDPSAIVDVEALLADLGL